jgi:hypothetical protein
MEGLNCGRFSDKAPALVWKFWVKLRQIYVNIKHPQGKTRTRFLLRRSRLIKHSYCNFRVSGAPHAVRLLLIFLKYELLKHLKHAICYSVHRVVKQLLPAIIYDSGVSFLLSTSWLPAHHSWLPADAACADMSCLTAHNAPPHSSAVHALAVLMMTLISTTRVH